MSLDIEILIGSILTLWAIVFLLAITAAPFAALFWLFG
jgi:hypothetical protein